jgi:hypothetical protein
MPSPTLCQYFRHQLAHRFEERDLAAPQVLDYVSEVLARFAHTRALYPFSDDGGRPLEHIVDLLAAGNKAGRAQAREIVRHIGEYTLFMSGLFRQRLRKRGELEYYLDQGSGAFGRCASNEPSPPRRQLYGRMHRQFRTISGALDELRRSPAPVPADTPAPILAALWRR